jgi:hypothetical protein
MISEWAALGSITSALIGAAVTYFVVVQRKKLEFTILEPWRQGTHPSLGPRERPSEEIGDQETELTVHCRGNRTIKDVMFEVVPDGKVTRPEVEVLEGGDGQLQHSVETNWSTKEGGTPRLKCSIPFLNPREFLRLRLRWHGNGRELQVFCRLEEVQVMVYSELAWQASPGSLAAVKLNWRRVAREFDRTGSIKEALGIIGTPIRKTDS